MELITEGRTRVVLLAGDYAFKFARLGLFYCLGRMLAIVAAQETTKKVAEWRRERGGVMRVVWQAMTSGIGANVREYRLSRKYPASEFAETLFTCGLLNIQRRGDRITEAEFSAHPIVQAVQKNTSQCLVLDTLRPNQFCRIEGRLRLADYGNPILADLLRSL